MQGVFINVQGKFEKGEEKCMTHKGTVRLETDRLILRRFVMEDLEPMYYHCWSDPEVWK